MASSHDLALSKKDNMSMIEIIEYPTNHDPDISFCYLFISTGINKMHYYIIIKNTRFLPIFRKSPVPVFADFFPYEAFAPPEDFSRSLGKGWGSQPGLPATAQPSHSPSPTGSATDQQHVISRWGGRSYTITCFL